MPYVPYVYLDLMENSNRLQLMQACLAEGFNASVSADGLNFPDIRVENLNQGNGKTSYPLTNEINAEAKSVS